MSPAQVSEFIDLAGLVLAGIIAIVVAAVVLWRRNGKGKK